MTTLATQDDVEAILGRALTTDESNRIDALLDAASARFRAAAGGRQFTPATSTLTARVIDGRVSLPQRPVVSVDSVTTVAPDGTAGVAIGTWLFDGISTVHLGAWRTLQINLPELDDSDDTVVVTYTHGDATVPDDVRWAVTSMVTRTLTQQSAAAGVVSETIGGYSYRVGDAAAAGALGMNADEQAIAARYRRPGLRSVSVL